jgi:hypothetical protein
MIHDTYRFLFGVQLGETPLGWEDNIRRNFVGFCIVCTFALCRDLYPFSPSMYFGLFKSVEICYISVLLPVGVSILNMQNQC